jgi:hypothetical protein
MSVMMVFLAYSINFCIYASMFISGSNRIKAIPETGA